MKVHVVLVGGESRWFDNVGDIGVSPAGSYHLVNADKKLICAVPISNILLIEIPEHDTSLTLISELKN